LVINDGMYVCGARHDSTRGGQGSWKLVERGYYFVMQHTPVTVHKPTGKDQATFISYHLC